MNRQELFDRIVAHLRAQGEQAKDPDDGCVLKTEDGLRCAVGCLIPPEKYDPYLENEALDFDIPGGALHTILREEGVQLEDMMMLMLFQEVHDRSIPEEWEREIKALAHRYDMTYTEPA